MSEVTGDYNQVDSFSFHPQSHAYPSSATAEDDSGNMTIDA